MDLRSKLRGYSVPDLLGKVAALQLSPSNASRIVRLEALAHTIASLPVENIRPEISASRLRQICEVPALEELSFAEDPAENMFAEEIPFFGGSYTVMPGIVGEGVFILENLSKAIFLNRDQRLPEDFRREAHDLFLGALTVSDFVLRSAGIRRGTVPVSNLGHGIEVPGTASLRRLRDAVMLSKKKIGELFRIHNLTPCLLAPLTCAPGSVDLKQFNVGFGDLLWRPFVDCGEHLVLTVPGMLVSAVRNLVLNRARRAGLLNEIALAYCKAVWDTVVRSLRYTRNEPLASNLPPWVEGRCSAEGLFSLDADKLLYCVLITDSLASFDPDNPFQSWTDDQLEEQLIRRISTIENLVFTSTAAPNELFVIALIQGFGGAGGLALRRPPLGSESLLTSAEHLRALCLVEGGDPLALLNFARAQTAVQKRSHVTSTSILDEFQVYRRNAYSYYVSDRERPDLIVIPPGDGLRIRADIAESRDFHAAPWFNSTLQVANLHSSSSIPLYVPLAKLEHHTAILVEGLPLPVWVTGPEHTNAEVHGIYAKFVDAIAYWLWQLQPHLRELIAELGRSEILHIRLELKEEAKWAALRNRDSDAEGDLICTFVDRANNRITVVLYPAFAKLLKTADNAGERELMRYVLNGFRELQALPEKSGFSNEHVLKLLDNVAPLGLKKMIVMTDAGVLPQLDPRDLPNYRKLQDTNINAILDEVGDYLLSQKNLSIGKIDPTLWTEVLNDVALYCFNCLADEVSRIDPQSLIEFLIAQSESVIRQTALDRLTLATRVECFGSVSTIRQELTKRIPELSHVALASRFLVEYVAAQPPIGYRPISLGLNDRLRALAYHMINFAMLSDALHFRIQEYEVSMLPSGRLGVAGEAWQDAMKNYMATSAQEHIYAAPVRFKAYWSSATAAYEDEELRKRLNAATKDEFGHSIEEIFALFDLAVRRVDESRPTVTRMPYALFIETGSERLGWQPSKVESLLEILSLRVRQSFWDPPTGFEKQDMYPWRYNRSVSYLRRPFIIASGESGNDVLWGKRHLREARNYLLDQVLSGKIQARGPELRSLNSELRHREGEAFNRDVAQFIAGMESTSVKSRVTKIADLTELETHLGDIDVLAADRVAKRVLVIECKDFSIARTPYEVAQEIKDLFVGKKNKKSTIEKHLERTKWIKNNLHLVCEFLGIRPSGKWKTIPLIVVDELLVAPYLKKSPIPIITLDELRRKWPRIYLQ